MEYQIEKKKVVALIYHDKINKLYTIYALGKGQPILSDTSIEDAKDKFEKALKLASAVRNLLYFEGSIKYDEEKTRMVYQNTILERIGNVEYHEISEVC